MTESSWPFDNQDSTEAQFSLLFRRAVDTGVVDPSGPAGGVLRPYGDASGVTVKVPAGDAVVQGFYYRSDAVNTLTVAAAASQARVDTVVLRLDTAANSVTAQVKTGTAGSSAPPALTQTDTLYELKLADVTVRANATSVAAGDVTDGRSFTGSNWGRWATATRPASPEVGRAGFNFTLGAPEFWTGSTWSSFGSSSSASSASSLTSGTLPNARLDYGVLAAFRGDRTVDAPVTNDVVNGDWNLVYQPGVYRVDGNRTNTNSAVTAGAYPYGTLVVFGAGSSIASRTQVYYPDTGYGGGAPWVRTAWNSTYPSAWQRLALYGEGGGSSSSGISQDDGAVAMGPNVSVNRGVLLRRQGGVCTLNWNININGSKAAGGDNTDSQNILNVPSGYRPPFPVDGFCHNGSATWGYAVDTDGWLRLRTGGIGGGGLWGSITYGRA